MNVQIRRLAAVFVAAVVAAGCGASQEVRDEVAARNAAAVAGPAGGGIGGSGGSTFGSGTDGSAGGSGDELGVGDADAPVAATGGAEAAVSGDAADPAAAAAAPAGGNGGATDIGVTQTSIRIGGQFFNGGFLDKYSQVTEQAASAYFRLVNDRGGIFGRKIDFVTCDTAGTVNGTQGCLRKLVEQDKVFVMGPALDFNLDTVQGFLDKHQVPWVGSSGLYDAEFSSPWMFPTQLKGGDVGTMIATFSGQRLEAKTIGVSWLTNGAGPSCLAQVRAVGEKLGFSVVVDASNGDTESDLTPQVLKIRERNPDAVLFCNDPVNNIKFIQAAGRQGYKPPKGFVGGFVAADDVPQAMGAPGIGFYGFSGYDFYGSDTPGVRRYRQIVSTYFPSTFFHFYSQAAYTGARAIVEAITQAGPDLTRDRFLQALRGMRSFDSEMGMILDFSNLAGQQPNGIMLQADEDLRWRPVTERFAGVR